jgi:hypothetical protein
MKKLKEETKKQRNQQGDTSTSSSQIEMENAGNGVNGNGNGSGGRTVDNGDERPRRRTLGDYAQNQGPRIHASIVMSLEARAIEINPTVLNYLNAHLFAKEDHEDPYNHLDDFYAFI